MNASTKDDRRRHSRVGFTTEIKIVLNVDDKQVNLEGNSKDLSLKGIFVNTDEQFTIGTQCSVKVFLTGSIEKIELAMHGTVVRQTANGVGIVFDSMDVETYSHLKNIVQYNSVEESFD